MTDPIQNAMKKIRKLIDEADADAEKYYQLESPEAQERCKTMALAYKIALSKLDRGEMKELENTIDQLTCCADNIFQDEFHTVIEKLIKKAKRRYRLEPPLGNWVNKREDLK